MILDALIIRRLLAIFLRLSTSKHSLLALAVNLPDDGHLCIISFICVLIFVKVSEPVRKVRYLSYLGRVGQELVNTSRRLDLLRADRVRAFISPVKSLMLWRRLHLLLLVFYQVSDIECSSCLL